MFDSTLLNPVVALRDAFDGLPDFVRLPIEMVVFGGMLPTTDISQMRWMAEELRTDAAALGEYAEDVKSMLAQEHSIGRFGDGFRDALDQQQDGAGSLREQAAALADQADAAANEAEKHLCVMFVFAIDLAVRLVGMLMAASASGPAGAMAAAPAAQASLLAGRARVTAMRAAWKQAYERIAADTAARMPKVGPGRFAVVGAVQAAGLTAGVDAGVQGLQVAAGHRDPLLMGADGTNPTGIDLRSIGLAGFAGVAGAAGGMLAARYVPTVFPAVGSSPMLTGLVHGTAGAVSGLGATALVAGWPEHYTEILGALVNGGFSGSMFARAGMQGPGGTPQAVDGSGGFVHPDAGTAWDGGPSVARGISQQARAEWAGAEAAWSSGERAGATVPDSVVSAGGRSGVPAEPSAGMTASAAAGSAPGSEPGYAERAESAGRSDQPAAGRPEFASAAAQPSESVPGAAERAEPVAAHGPSGPEAVADRMWVSPDVGGTEPGAVAEQPNPAAVTAGPESVAGRVESSGAAVGADAAGAGGRPETTGAPGRPATAMPAGRIDAPALDGAQRNPVGGRIPGEATRTVSAAGETAPPPRGTDTAANRPHASTAAASTSTSTELASAGPAAEAGDRPVPQGAAGGAEAGRNGTGTDAAGFRSSGDGRATSAQAETDGGGNKRATAGGENTSGERVGGAAAPVETTGEPGVSGDRAVPGESDASGHRAPAAEAESTGASDGRVPEGPTSRERAEEILADFHARSAEHLPANLRLSKLSDEAVAAGLFHGDERDSLIAGMEIIRRQTVSEQIPGGMVVRHTQLEGALELAAGRPVEMLPGQGKTLMFMLHSMRQAVSEGSVLLVTTADGLAHREFTAYRRVLEPFGIDVVRADQESGFGHKPGRPSIVVATGETVGHLCNSGQQAPPRSVVIDEMDAVVDRGEKTFIRSESQSEAAAQPTAQEVFDAHDFLAGALAKGQLSHEDFGLKRLVEEVDIELPDGSFEIGADYWYDGQASLTSAGVEKVRALPGGQRWLQDMGRSRLEMAAAAEFTTRNKTHYVMDQGKIVLIDQGEHGLQRNPKTSSETRWSAEEGKAGLAQAVEAKEIRAAETIGMSAEQHGIVVRADTDSARSITAAEIYGTDRFFDHVTGASGTLADLGGVLKTVYHLDPPHRVDPYTPSRLVEGAPEVHENTRAKLHGLAESAHAMWDGGQGRFQEILCHRNDLVEKQVNALVRAGVPREAIEAVDATRIAKWGAEWETRLQNVFDAAGAQGKILVINRQGQRGVDISPSDEVLAQGGMHVWMTEVPEQSYIYEQGKNRTARNGAPGSTQAFMSPQDGIIRNAMHLSGVRETVVSYEQAVGAHRANPTRETHHAVVESADALASRVPGLQERAHHQQTAQFLLRYAPISEPEALLEAVTPWHPDNADIAGPDTLADRSTRLAGLLGVPPSALAAAAASTPENGAIPGDDSYTEGTPAGSTDIVGADRGSAPVTDTARDTGAATDETTRIAETRTAEEADPLRELLRRAAVPPAAVEALHQYIDATAPGRAVRYGLLTDEQALEHLTVRRAQLAAALGWDAVDIEGAEGLRQVGNAAAAAQRELARALTAAADPGPSSERDPGPSTDVSPALAEVSTAMARDILGEALMGEAAGSAANRQYDQETEVAIVRADRTVPSAEVVEGAAHYLATTALLDLVTEIHRRSPNNCVDNGVTGMRVLFPDKADHFTMPPGGLALRGRDWATTRQSFRNGAPQEARSLDDAVASLKRRPGGAQVLVYRWKNSEGRSTDAENHLVVLVNDSTDPARPNLKAVDLAASPDGDYTNDFGPEHLADRRALLNRAVPLATWQREQERYLGRLPAADRRFWTINFDTAGELVPTSLPGTAAMTERPDVSPGQDRPVDETPAPVTEARTPQQPARPPGSRIDASNSVRGAEPAHVGARPSEDAVVAPADPATTARRSPPADTGISAGADAGEPNWRVRRLRDELELTRYLYHKEETKQAARAMIVRMREVLTVLHPDATEDQIERAFLAPERVLDGMVPRSVSLDELLADGNLRQLMQALYNPIVRRGDLVPEFAGTEYTVPMLYAGLARLMNERGKQQSWEGRARDLGLDDIALKEVRDRITGGDPQRDVGEGELKDIVNQAHDAPDLDDIVAERTWSSAEEREFGLRQQVRRGITVQDWALLGMPLSRWEIQAIPGELVALRKSRLDPRRELRRDEHGLVREDILEDLLRFEDQLRSGSGITDAVGPVRFVIAAYAYDDNGRRMRDESGDAVVTDVFVYRDAGVVDAETALALDPGEFAVPLPWGTGSSTVTFDKEGRLFRELAVEQGIPLLAGISGSAARLASAFRWLRPVDVDPVDFAGAILAKLSPIHHSMYEQLRGMQLTGLRLPLVDEAVSRARYGAVNEMFAALSEQFDRPPLHHAPDIAPVTLPDDGDTPRVMTERDNAGPSGGALYEPGGGDAGSSGWIGSRPSDSGGLVPPRPHTSLIDAAADHGARQLDPPPELIGRRRSRQAPVTDTASELSGRTLTPWSRPRLGGDRSPGTTLDEGLVAPLHQPGWRVRAPQLGVDAEALGAVRDQITGGPAGAIGRRPGSEPGPAQAVAEDFLRNMADVLSGRWAADVRSGRRSPDPQVLGVFEAVIEKLGLAGHPDVSYEQWLTELPGYSRAATGGSLRPGEALAEAGIRHQRAAERDEIARLPTPVLLLNHLLTESARNPESPLVNPATYRSADACRPDTSPAERFDRVHEVFGDPGRSDAGVKAEDFPLPGRLDRKTRPHTAEAAAELDRLAEFAQDQADWANTVVAGLRGLERPPGPADWEQEFWKITDQRTTTTASEAGQDALSEAIDRPRRTRLGEIPRYGDGPIWIPGRQNPVGLPTWARETFAAAGARAPRRFTAEGVTGDILEIRIRLTDGTTALGRRLIRGETAENLAREIRQRRAERTGKLPFGGPALGPGQVFSETSREEERTRILNDAFTQLAAPGEFTAATWAEIAYKLFHAPQRKSGSDAVIRSFMAAAGVHRLGRVPDFPHDIDLLAMVTSQDEFIALIVEYGNITGGIGSHPNTEPVGDATAPGGAIGRRPSEDAAGGADAGRGWAAVESLRRDVFAGHTTIADIGVALQAELRALPGGEDHSVLGFDRVDAEVDIGELRVYAQAVLDICTVFPAHTKRSIVLGRHDFPRHIRTYDSSYPGERQRQIILDLRTGRLRGQPEPLPMEISPVGERRGDSADRARNRWAVRDLLPHLGIPGWEYAGQLVLPTLMESFEQDFAATARPVERQRGPHWDAFDDWQVLQGLGRGDLMHALGREYTVAVGVAAAITEGRAMADSPAGRLYELLAAQDGIEKRPITGHAPMGELREATNAEKLGVPADLVDEFSVIGADADLGDPNAVARVNEAVGDRLRGLLRGVPGHENIKVVGFDSPHLDTDVVKEVARGMVWLMQTYPETDIREVGFGNLSYTDGAKAATLPAHGAVRCYTKSIVFDTIWAENAGEVRKQVRRTVASGLHPESFLLRPVIAYTAHEYMHALGVAGSNDGEMAALEALADLYLAEERGEPTPAGWLAWLRTAIPAYGFDEAGRFIAEESVADGGADVAVRRYVLGPHAEVRAPSLVQHDLLVEAAARNAQHGRWESMLDAHRFRRNESLLQRYRQYDTRIGVAGRAFEAARARVLGAVDTSGSDAYSDRPESPRSSNAGNGDGSRSEESRGGMGDGLIGSRPSAVPPAQRYGPGISDEWSELIEAGTSRLGRNRTIGARLQSVLRALPGHDGVVVKFDDSRLTPEVLAEFARAWVTLFTRYPDVDVPVIEPSVLWEGEAVSAFASDDPRRTRVAGSPAEQGSPKVPALYVNRRFFVKPDVFRAETGRTGTPDDPYGDYFLEHVHGAVAAGELPAMVPDRPAYAVAVLAFAVALDISRDRRAHPAVDELLREAFAGTGRPQHGPEFRRWQLEMLPDAFEWSTGVLDKSKALALGLLSTELPEREEGLLTGLAGLQDADDESAPRSVAATDTDPVPLPEPGNAALMPAMVTDDEWAALSTGHDIATHLREALYAETGRHFEVTGFDSELDLDVLREYARTAFEFRDDLAVYNVPEIAVIDTKKVSGTRSLGYAERAYDEKATPRRYEFEHPDGRPVRLHAMRLVLDRNYAENAENFWRAMTIAADSGYHPDSVRHRPVRAVVLHELGHAADYAGHGVARTLIANALLNHYIAKRLGPATEAGYQQWLQSRLCGYSFHAGGQLNMGEAIAAAFSDVRSRGYDNVGDATRIIYDLTVNAADSSPAGRARRFLDRQRFGAARYHRGTGGMITRRTSRSSTPLVEDTDPHGTGDTIRSSGAGRDASTELIGSRPSEPDKHSVGPAPGDGPRPTPWALERPGSTGSLCNPSEAPLDIPWTPTAERPAAPPLPATPMPTGIPVVSGRRLPSPHLRTVDTAATPAHTGRPSAPPDVTTTPDDVPRQAIGAPITTPPRLASPWHSPGTSPPPAVLTGSGSSIDDGPGTGQSMVVPDDSDPRRSGGAPAEPANPARERDGGNPLFAQEPVRVQRIRDIDEPPIARREGEMRPPMPGERPPADERGWRDRRTQDESELARVLYHRPETRQSVISVIDRLREVLSALHPQATREQIDNAFYTPEETISGGMVLRSVPLDELKRDGNVRELMAAVQNAMWRSRELPNPSGTTLDDGLVRLLNQPDWNERAHRLGLNVDALNRLCETITGGDPDVPIVAAELRQGRNAMSDPGFISIREEITRSGAHRTLREIPDQVRLSLTVQDWALLGMPLSIRELEAIPGGLVAHRKTRLDPELPLPRDTRGHVDVKTLEARLAAEGGAFRNIIPLYRYDEHGRRIRDESGHAVVDRVIAYREEGPVDAATALRLDPHQFAVPLPWRPGAGRFEFETDDEWFRQTAVERGVPVVSGVSGTAARIASKFIWIMPPDISTLDFAGAILSILLPAHHSLYETVGGLALVGLMDAAIFRASDSTVGDLYEAVFDQFGLSGRRGLSESGREYGPGRGPYSHSGTHYAITEPELLPRTGEYDLPDRRIRSIFDEEVRPALLIGRPRRPLEQVEEPVLYVVGGQPGAGKSTLVDRVCDRLADRGGAALIQADELEKFHPAYSRLYRENDFTAHDYLVPTAQKLRNMFEEFLIPLRYNVLLEGGNSDPRRTLARIQRIAESRSRAIMEVIALPREQSDLARLERFVYGRETEGFGRYLTRRTHNRLYLGSSELVRLVESARPISVDTLRISTRTGLLYENHRSSDGQWRDPPRARAALEAERDRAWTPEECWTFEERIAGLSELVRAKVAQHPARWAPLVHEIDELRVLAEPKLSRPAR
ncbi:zeta toxin family protein [Nocardia carnea]|uniref:UDP-N-acetylglucosamine kinase n=1 Tax=Nocardia carnea TaxID=37328 RepID=A0ABW7TL73_9NOCA|nr:zeta toxin family protein [Nocardia carnea]